MCERGGPADGQGNQHKGLERLLPNEICHAARCITPPIARAAKPLWGGQRFGHARVARRRRDAATQVLQSRPDVGAAWRQQWGAARGVSKASGACTRSGNSASGGSKIHSTPADDSACCIAASGVAARHSQLPNAVATTSCCVGARAGATSAAFAVRLRVRSSWRRPWRRLTQCQYRRVAPPSAAAPATDRDPPSVKFGSAGSSTKSKAASEAHNAADFRASCSARCAWSVGLSCAQRTRPADQARRSASSLLAAGNQSSPGAPKTSQRAARHSGRRPRSRRALVMKRRRSSRGHCPARWMTPALTRFS